MSDISHLTKAEIAEMIAPLPHTSRNQSRLVSNEMRADAVVFLSNGMTRREVADHLGVSKTTIDRIAWHAQEVGLLDSGTEIKVSTLVMTGARKIAAERLLRRRFCKDHIAEHLTRSYEGPRVMARDVVQFQQLLGAK